MEESPLRLEADIIKNKIYSFRGMHVMLDRDLAELYNVKAIRLREQVKRNPKRFPPDFMFQLTDSEVELLVSQNAIASKKLLGGYLPYAFIPEEFENLIFQNGISSLRSQIVTLEKGGW